MRTGTAEDAGPVTVPAVHVVPAPARPPRPLPAGARSVAVIANPATRLNARTLAASLAHWRAGFGDVTVHYTDGPGMAERLARGLLGQADVIAAAGGDGTVGEVATALAGTVIPLGIIPAGSTNIVAKELGIPPDPSAALDLIAASGHVLEMDLAFVNDRAMLHMAGAGWDSRLFALADPRLKRWLGWGAYLPAGIRASLARPVPLRISTERESFAIRSPLVLIANGSSIINRQLRIDVAPQIDDGLLDLFIVTATEPLPTLETVLHALTGGLGDAPDVTYRQVTSVHIESPETLPYEVDGDVVGNLPIDVTVAPRALRVIVPSPPRRRERPPSW